MLLFWNLRWLLLHFIFGQLNFPDVTTSWPWSNASRIQLLGLFEDAENATETTDLSVHSRAMFKAALLLSQQYDIRIEGEFLGWQAKQTGGNVIDALSDTCQSTSEFNTVGIIGPGLSREAYLIAAFGQTIGIPVISYSATDPDLFDRNVYPAFYRTVSSDNAAALAVVQLFLRFNWTSCVIIYQNDAFGSGGAKVISEAFNNQNLIVRNMVIFNVATKRIRGNLKNYLINSATRIVVVWAEATYTSLILQDALDSDVLGPRFTWILSSSVPLSSFNQTSHKNLIGMLSIEPVTGTVVGAPINTTLLNTAYDIWEQYEPESFPKSRKVNYYALFAFDATWILIQALKQLCSEMQNSSLSFTGSSYCFNRRFVHSNLLFDAINKISFLGVSGPIGFSVNLTDRINGSYYYAQNVQSFSDGLSFVPVLYYSDSTDWTTYTGSNMIVWPGNTLMQPTGRPLLDGVTLRIGIIESEPFTKITKTIDAFGKNQTKYVGYVPDLIQFLQDTMKFIPDVRLAPANQTYSQIIQAVANGDYDVVIGDVTITAKRREVVDFSNAIFDNSLRIIMRKTSPGNIDLLSFLKPFSRNLWLLIFAAFVYAGTLLCLIERNNNEALQNRSIFSQFAMSVWYSFGNTVGYGVDFDVNSAAGRLLTAGLYILSLVLVASYTANLASDLTILKSQDIISGIDDIKNGKLPLNRIGIRFGTASEGYYLREISGGNRNFYPLKSRKELYESLLAGIIDVSFLDIGVAEYVTNNIYCNLTLIGDGVDLGAFGIVTSKEWLYMQDLDVHILSLRENGTLNNLRQKWFQGKSCPDLSKALTAMEIESMSGLFLVFGVISILSLFLFFWSKRDQIKNYLITSIFRKRPSSKRKESIEGSERSQNYELSSCDFSHL